MPTPSPSEPPRPLRATWAQVTTTHPRVSTSRAVLQGRASLVLCLDDGVHRGLGEASPLTGFFNGDSLAQAGRELETWSERLQEPPGGESSAPPSDLPDPLARARAFARGLTSPAARHAAEGAYLDWLEQRSGEPWFWGLLTPGQSAPLRLRQSQVLDPLAEDFLRQVQELASQGIDTLKLKLGRDDDAELAQLCALSALGLPLRLRLDPNLAWSAEQAQRMLTQTQKLLAGGPCQLEFVEDPTTDLGAWGALARLAPLAIDEPLLRPEGAESAYAAARVVVCKPMVLGGPSRTWELAQLAQRQGKQVSLSHCFDGPIALGVSTRLAFALQAAELAPGLGAHAGLSGWRELDLEAALGLPSAPSPLPAPELSPAHLERPRFQDGLSSARAARAFVARPAVLFPQPGAPAGGELSALSYAELAARAELRARSLEELPVLAVCCEPSEAALTELCAAWLVGLPVLLLHPALPEGERQELLDRTLRHAAELLPGDAVVVPTSGSTGTPHLVVHTRASLLAASQASRQHLGLPQPGDRWLLGLPFAHIGGLSVLTRSWGEGASVVLARLDPDPRVAVSQLQGWQIQEMSLVPTQLGRLLSGPEPPLLPDLRLILVGGAACPRPLLERARALGLPVSPTYGMTELGSQVATLPPDQPLRDGAVGPLLPGVVARSDESGRLVLGGPMRLRCYLGEPTPLAADGGFISSDLGSIDVGELTVRGRADHRIISGGENVSPEAVEAVLLTLPEVEQVCVVGVADPTWGEQVVALWVARDFANQEPCPVGAWVSPPQFRQALEHRLPPYALPKAWIRLLVLPNLPSGKLDRRRAQDIASELRPLAGAADHAPG